MLLASAAECATQCSHPRDLRLLNASSALLISDRFDDSEMRLWLNFTSVKSRLVKEITLNSGEMAVERGRVETPSKLSGG